MNERELSAKWRQHGPSISLSGVHVRFPGWENHEEGPDFLNALIEVDGRLVRGDVEIHCDARDWHAHGHDRDTRYNHVILHVVAELHALLKVATQNGRTIPTVLFSDFRPGRSFDIRQSSLVNLEAGGWRRFEDKVNRLRRWADQEGLEGALYKGLLDAYGYAKFRKPFRKLSQLVPLRLLWHPAGLKKLHTMANRLRWKGAFVRPANRPSSRLWELAAVLAGHQGHLRLAVQNALKGSKPRVALERLGARTKGLGRSVAVNVLLPWIVVASRAERRPLWAALARKWFREWPALPSNTVTRRVAHQIFGLSDRKIPLTALTQQGLHWIAKHPESLFQGR